ncbi:MAG: hypothetical protein JRJ57_01695 [Deltaproteobacteria bacterium]|nr:hypothetical protein [Deltaproteobacteria bacterium]
MIKGERENWKQEMFSLIEKWNNSGIKQKDFCDRHDLSLPTFLYWLRKYRQAQSSAPGSFIQVDVDTPGNTSGEDIQIHYPNGVTVSLDKRVSISRIKALIKAV